MASALFHLSVPPPPAPTSSQKLRSGKCSSLSFVNRDISSSSPRISTLVPRSVSSPETPVVEQEQERETQTPSSVDELSLNSGGSLPPPLTGCKACGKEEIENGCNGEGRIQGGIATVPGFGWWPIKAYRPCPAFVASGGRYRRFGQSMDEVVSGGGGRGTPDGVQSSKKKEGPKKLER